MQQLPIVILEHAARDNRHFDLMLADPGEQAQSPGTAAARLWTVQIPTGLNCWRTGDVMPATELALHRPDFWHEQGALTRQRGIVRRIARGRASPLLWTQDRRVVAARLDEGARAAVQLQLQRIAPRRWQLQVLNIES